MNEDDHDDGDIVKYSIYSSVMIMIYIHCQR